MRSSSHPQKQIERPLFYRAPRQNLQQQQQQHLAVNQQSDYPWKVTHQVHRPRQQVSFSFNNSLTQNQMPKPFGLAPIGSNRGFAQQQIYPTIYETSHAGGKPGYPPTHYESTASSNYSNHAANRQSWPNQYNQYTGYQDLGLPQSHASYQQQGAIRQVSPVRGGAVSGGSPLSINQGISDTGVPIGHVPAFKTVVPNSKADEFMWNRELERASISHQTYRTLPIVQPKPKARHDLPTGNYMSHVTDPTWNLQQSRPPSVSKNYEQKIRMAIDNMKNQVGPRSRVVVPYNTPINLYSSPSINESISRAAPNQPTMFKYR